MATRSTITVKTNRLTVHLYRHWDGYPECTGRHLAWAMNNLESLSAEELVGTLITAKEGQPFGSGRYEFTTRASDHGDTEWHYEITLHHREEPKVEVWHRPIGESYFLAFNAPLHGYRKWMAGRMRTFIARIKQMMAERAA
ncbi:hypothetical protein [Roseovarius sp. MMSF_3281]|uniref:hypothetical protein n=1 Tax=Roseovarius sp. MMSF_3281 TaxID=3046694 RepID=UPI00273DB134|nr:hypothetical protein [Roseovarius sp. MMSF_3281]